MPDAGYVRLDARFGLRGWLGRPYAVVDHLTATAHFIPKELFDTLQLCNGRFRETDAVFIGPRKAHLRQLEREGLLAFSPEPAALEPWQEYRSYPNRYMRKVQWSMTGRCNYRCRHCFMCAPHGVLPQPSTEECLRIADQIAASGVQVVKLTGGECLIRSDFLQIVDRLLDGGVQIATILSNGALVTGDLLCALEQRGVRCGFDISFDGVDGWHEWLRGVPGSEKAAVRAFELCREHGFPTGAQVMLHRGSAPSLRKTVQLLGSLGVSSVLVDSIEDEGEAHGMRELLLDYDELFDICSAYLQQFLEDGSPVRRINLGGIYEVVDGVPRMARGRVDAGDSCASRPACATVQTDMYLDPAGFILPCSPLSYDEGVKGRFPNIAHMTLSEALADSSHLDLVLATVGDVAAHNGKCRTCPYLGRCMGGCRVKAVDENGGKDLLGFDPDSCRFFLEGYYDRAADLVDRLSAFEA